MLMLTLLEEAGHGTDYDETLLPVAIGLTVIALAYAAIATWIVTPKGVDH